MKPKSLEKKRKLKLTVGAGNCEEEVTDISTDNGLLTTVY